MIDPADNAPGAWLDEVFTWDAGRRDQVGVTCETVAYGEHRDQVVDVWRPRADGSGLAVVRLRSSFLRSSSSFSTCAALRVMTLSCSSTGGKFADIEYSGHD